MPQPTVLGGGAPPLTINIFGNTVAYKFKGDIVIVSVGSPCFAIFSGSCGLASKGKKGSDKNNTRPSGSTFMRKVEKFQGEHPPMLEVHGYTGSQ